MTDDPPPLFDLDAVRLDSPELVAYKAAVATHDIQAHCSTTAAPAWLAIPMRQARATITDAGLNHTRQQVADIPEIIMSFGRLLDEAGLLFYAHSERDAKQRAVDAIAFRQLAETKVARN